MKSVFLSSAVTVVLVACANAKPAEAPKTEPTASAAPSSTSTSTSESEEQATPAETGSQLPADVGGSGDPITTDSPAVVREGVVVVNGKLERDIVRRVARGRFPAIRRCYELGWQQNPKLQGRVTVKFAIDQKGEIAQVADGGSEISDANVVNCVTRQFAVMKFPAPESGIRFFVDVLGFD